MEENTDILDGLEDRLQQHAKAFESLLALTPAREYYGSQIDDGHDPSEQWQRKKQTKEEKRAAKKAKLDPANQKSALDVMKERERKRKRELGIEDEAEDGEQPKEDGEASSKRQKVDGGDDEAKRRARVEKRKEKRLQKKEKIARKKAKADAKKAAKQSKDLDEAQAEKRHADGDADEEMEDDATPQSEVADAEIDSFDATGLADLIDDAGRTQSEASSAPSSPAIDSPAFDIATNNSTDSSSSSIIPPATAEPTTTPAPPNQPALPKKSPAKPTIDTTAPPKRSAQRTSPPSGISSPKLILPDIDQETLQARLRARIEELRAKRKADGDPTTNKPAKSRQELLEQRRKKEEARKAAKKEQRRKAKEEESRQREEQLRGSGSPLSVDIFSPRATEGGANNNFSFSRLAFDDGTAADASLSTLTTPPSKKKGPQDPRTALEAAEKKQARLASYDPAKQADIKEKDMWLHAKKRAQGERVRDDTSLLKKALKRKEKMKGKSAEAWREREEGVVRGREMKQKRREANLAKRREEKGGGGKGKGKGGKAKGKGKGGKKRPGFEGSLRA